jgi:pimeloyl-ACP methyl ester carboxylesterase
LPRALDFAGALQVIISLIHDEGLSMIDEAAGAIDYQEADHKNDHVGPTIVFVPGSCSTGAAWRPVIAALNGRYRCVTTSLLGYGGTAERRTADDVSIQHEIDIVEAVIRRAGGPVHLVGHSFGGLVSLAVALRGAVPLASLTIAEAPGIELLRETGELEHYRAFREMTDGYFAAFGGGDKEAIATMIDFYAGPGAFASWPPRVRAYAVETTPVNILDWASAYNFTISPALLARLDLPVLVMRGGASHPAVQRLNELLSVHIAGASLATIPGAAHFMISTHAEEVARAIVGHVGAHC